MKIKILIISLLLFIGIFGTAEARLKKYTYTYDISELEWQLLNWTAAWRGTNKPADPFILEKMEYDRRTWKIKVYLTGKDLHNTPEELDKSMRGIVSVLSERFPEFEPQGDLIIYYTLTTDDPAKNIYIKYNQGSFYISDTAFKE